MARKSMFEIEALLRMLQNSKAVKAMDPFAVYALLKEIQNPDSPVIDKIYEILIKEQAGYEKIEQDFTKKLKKTVDLYQYEIDNIGSKTILNNTQQLEEEIKTTEEQRAEAMLQSLNL